MQTEAKVERFKNILEEMKTVLVAYSGGVDSTFLATVAHEVLCSKMVAVFVSGPIFPEEEQVEAEITARKAGFPYRTIELDILQAPGFSANPPDRCYHCRIALFGRLKQIAFEEGLDWVIDGTNYDDLTDYRPGRRAAEESGVRSPLIEAELTKEEVRHLSREKGLPTWNKPASPCLASRIPYGTPVTLETLQLISEGEKFLHSLGLGQLRLRHHGDIARIEVDEKEIGILLKDEIRRKTVEHMKSLGYKYVTLDLTGYRTGSLNIGLESGT
jgi:uncharacterized protein